MKKLSVSELSHVIQTYCELDVLVSKLNEKVDLEESIASFYTLE